MLPNGLAYAAPMASWGSRAAVYGIGVWRRRMAHKAAAGQGGRIPGAGEPPRGITRWCDVARREVQGRDVYTLTPKRSSGNGRHVLFLHGGSYAGEALPPHWYWAARLARRTGQTVTFPDYPLAPEQTVVEAHAMVEEVLDGLLDAASPAQVTTMGDSAGAGMALAIAQTRRDRGLRQPGRLVLLSPWIDLTMTNPQVEPMIPDEPLLDVGNLVACGIAYAADRGNDHATVSPLYGSFEDLPPMAVWMGTRDLFLPDVRLMIDKARAAGAAVEYREYPEMFHVWMLGPFAEGRRATAEVRALLAQPMAGASS